MTEREIVIRLRLPRPGRRLWLLVGGIVMVLFVGVAYAAVTWPASYTSGQTLSASDITSRFNDLNTRKIAFLGYTELAGTGTAVALTANVPANASFNSFTFNAPADGTYVFDVDMSLYLSMGAPADIEAKVNIDGANYPSDHTYFRIRDANDTDSTSFHFAATLTKGSHTLKGEWVTAAAGVTAAADSTCRFAVIISG